MKTNFILLVMLLVGLQQAQAKIWRINNNSGVQADFTTLNNAVTNASVLSGDTIHLEPSTNGYGGCTLNKNLVIIGNGYLLSGTNGNPGLQENTANSIINGNITLTTGSSGSKLIGLYFWSVNIVCASGYTGNLNILVEKCNFYNAYIFTANQAGGTYSNFTVRKCYLGFGFYVYGGNVYNNFTVENCISFTSFAFNPDISSNNNIFRNNVCWGVFDGVKCYVANNIFYSGGSFDNCVVSNNIFCNNQTGVTVGPLSTNGNNLINVPYTSIFAATGSDDAWYQLAAGSPAIGGGVQIGSYKPDCGAYGGPDPYKLSGIPGIPTIYGLTAPSSIPVGTPSMNATISTRNNN